MLFNVYTIARVLKKTKETLQTFPEDFQVPKGTFKSGKNQKIFTGHKSSYKMDIQTFTCLHRCTYEGDAESCLYTVIISIDN